ncbi:MAG: hypothetical protein AB8B69_27660 [Chitinophagales bacterium]
MRQFDPIFDEAGNLTMESQILYVYALHLSKVDELPPALVAYFWEDAKSRKKILDFYKVYSKEMAEEHPHEYFSSTGLKGEITPIDWQNLDEVLEEIVRSALIEQFPLNRVLERKMVGQFKNSSATTAFKVLVPEEAKLCVQTIFFEFNQSAPQDLWLDLKNAKGKIVVRFEIEKGNKRFEFSIADEQQFPSGLYYWTLLIDDLTIINRLYICTKEDVQNIQKQR